MNRLQIVILCLGAALFVYVVAGPYLHPAPAAPGDDLQPHHLPPAAFAIALGTGLLARLAGGASRGVSGGVRAPTLTVSRAAELRQKNLPPPSDDVVRLWRAGKRIDAIKAYRAQSGADLRDAKDMVEALDGPA